jgi:fructose-specific phosphotransferase system IIC component
MDNRRRAAALAGSAAAMAGTIPLFLQRSQASDFTAGLVMGLVLAILAGVVILLRRGKSCPRG